MVNPLMTVAWKVPIGLLLETNNGLAQRRWQVRPLEAIEEGTKLMQDRRRQQTLRPATINGRSYFICFR